MAKFKSGSGGHVRIFRPGQSATIDIDEGDTYETDDKDEIRALKASPEVDEVKASKDKSSSKDE